MDPVLDPFAIAAGFGIGAIVGLTGVGGGSLMTPLLIGAFRLSPAVAIGTDLWFAAITKFGGAVSHARQRQLDGRVTALLLAGSLPAALATLVALRAGAVEGGRPGALACALGLALLLTALTVAMRRRWHALGLRLEHHLGGRRRVPLTVIAGALLGVLVTLSSIGAGAIGAALILLLYPRMPVPRLVGTDIAHAVPLTLVAGIGHASLGHVDWPLLAALLVGSLPGIALGARLTAVLPEAAVRLLLCAALLTAGWRVMA